MLPVLYMAFKETPAHSWDTHKDKINNWYECKILLHNRFGAEQEKKYMDKYDGVGQPREHIDRCII